MLIPSIHNEVLSPVVHATTGSTAPVGTCVVAHALRCLQLVSLVG